MDTDAHKNDVSIKYKNAEEISRSSISVRVLFSFLLYNITPELDVWSIIASKSKQKFMKKFVYVTLTVNFLTVNR